MTSTPTDPIAGDSLRSARESAPAAAVAAPRRSSSTSGELADAIEALTTARGHALQKFEDAAALIADGLRAYGEAWRHAVRCSRDLDSGPAASMPATGGPLQPATSELHPKRLKAALARVLTNAGVDIFDMPTRIGGGRRRGRR